LIQLSFARKLRPKLIHQIDPRVKKAIQDGHADESGSKRPLRNQKPKKKYSEDDDDDTDQVPVLPKVTNVVLHLFEITNICSLHVLLLLINKIGIDW
jgi:hypothetical protein